MEIKKWESWKLKKKEENLVNIKLEPLRKKWESCEIKKCESLVNKKWEYCEY